MCIGSNTQGFHNCVTIASAVGISLFFILKCDALFVLGCVSSFLYIVGIDFSASLSVSSRLYIFPSSLCYYCILGNLLLFEVVYVQMAL